MAKSDKVAAVAELVERFRAADAVLLTEYRGLTVGQLKQLRRGLGENATYAVAKNTLARLAAKEVGLDFLAEDLKGPTAIAFVSKAAGVLKAKIGQAAFAFNALPVKAVRTIDALREKQGEAA